jgi:hypothetical protein
VCTKTTKLFEMENSAGNGWFNLGVSLTKLGQVERKLGGGDDEQSSSSGGGGSLGVQLARVAAGADAIAALTSKKRDEQRLCFEETFEDYSRMVQAVKLMLKQRSDLSLTRQTQESEYRAEKKKFDAVANAQGKAKQHRLLQHSSEEAKAQLDVCSAQLDKVTKTSLGEVQRFHAQKKQDLSRALKQFVATQVRYAKQAAATWEAVAKQLD